MELPRYRTGDAALDAEIARLVESVEPGHSDELLFEMIVTALRHGDATAPTAAT